jgi:hypothetical protein
LRVCSWPGGGVVHLPDAARGEVVALARDDVPHAAPWVVDVAAVARDQVDVQVEDGLAGGPADVDADVVAVRAVAAGDQLAAVVEGLADGLVLLGAGVEPGGHVPPRDDEQVARARGEGVPEGEDERSLEGDAVRGG